MFPPRTLLKLVDQESAQNSIEYMLVIGAVAVLIIAALVLAFPHVVYAVVGLACESIDTAATSVFVGSCIVGTP
jgi:Flp pilus assembly pilin Flp